MYTSVFGLAALASFALRTACALPTISVKGSKFFANGQQFFLKGVAYQGTPSDPLIDTTQCQLDAASMKTIGTNSIRVYHVNPYINHDGCMTAFEDAGIYVWLDLDTFNTTIEQTAPQWTSTQFLAFTQVMDVFQHYNNLGGFWIGNEIINNAGGSPAAPYVKAAVTDMKAYMTAKKYRQVPIGYSAADIAELRPMLQNYLTCGSDPSQSIDFFGLNSYEWCGVATFQTSGYSQLQAMAQGYNVPLFFSETGCNVGGPRTFADQTAIFGPDMAGTWSGSIIYEWVQEANNYGLVTYPNGQIYSGAPIPISPDFANLQKVWASINPTGVAESAYTPTNSAPACPAASAGWAVNGNVAIPTLGASVIQAVAVGQPIVQVSAAPSVASKVVATTTNPTPGMETTSSPSLAPGPPSSSFPSPSSSSSSLIPSPSTSTASSTGSVLVPTTSTVTSSTSSIGSRSPTETNPNSASSALMQTTTSTAPSTATTSHSAGSQNLVPFVGTFGFDIRKFNAYAGEYITIVFLASCSLGFIGFLS